MKRRRFLLAAATTGLVAGCMSDGSGGDPTERTVETEITPSETAGTATETGTTPPEATTTVNGAETTSSEVTTEAPAMRATTSGETSTESSEIQRRVSLQSVDDVPRGHELQMDAELLEKTVTADHTARVRVTTTDTSGRKRRIEAGGTGDCSLFNRDKGLSDPTGLWLHEPSSADYIDRVGDHWTPDRNGQRVSASYGCGYVPAVHEKPIVSEYLLWDDYRKSGYMKPGTYRFETEVSTGSDSTGIATITVDGSTFRIRNSSASRTERTTRVEKTSNDPSATAQGTVHPEPHTQRTTNRTSAFTWGFDLVVEKP